MKRKQGNPTELIEVTAYHGSGNPITQFDYRFTGIGNDQIGSGFYFTDDMSEAVGYTTGTLNGEPKPGGTDNPTVHVVRLSLRNPLPHSMTRDLTIQEARAIILHAPNLDDALMNWGDVERDGRTKVLNKAAPFYAPGPGDEPIELLRQLHPIGNDFFDGETEAFNRAIEEVLGFDSVICAFEKSGHTHYVAFFPEQIEILERISQEEARARLERGEPAAGPEIQLACCR